MDNDSSVCQEQQLPPPGALPALLPQPEAFDGSLLWSSRTAPKWTDDLGIANQRIHSTLSASKTELAPVIPRGESLPFLKSAIFQLIELVAER